MKQTKVIDAPDDWASLKYHPLSELCEFNAGIDLESLAADMQNGGYDATEPVVLFEGKILDGRHKCQGAIKAEVAPAFAEFTGDYAAALRYVRRKKLFRQHLSESQRAVFAAKLLKIQKTNPANLRDSGPQTQPAAAKALNVSERLVNAATKVLEEGTDKLKKAVERGDVKVSAAANVVSESAEVQDALAAVSEPAKCANCKRRGSRLRDCPACAEAQAKADKKAAKSGLRKKGKHKTAAAKPLSWTWFEKAVAEMSRFLLELKPKDREHRDRVSKKVTELANTAKHFRYTEDGK